jgi:hypothetical protein
MHASTYCPGTDAFSFFITGFRLLDIYNVNVMDRTVVVEVLHQLRWEDGRYLYFSHLI